MKDLIISPDCTIKQALSALSKVGEKCLIVAGEDMALLGTLSDGDLRKAILRGVSITDPMGDIYQRKPTVLKEGDYTLDEVKKLFFDTKFDLLPVVDCSGTVVDALVWDRVFQDGEKRQLKPLDAPVVIMAGGKGTRLEPFTKILPKPLIPIHEKPVIEHIIEKFTAVGVTDFLMTVNYKGRILKAFFEEMQPSYTVNFVEEQEPLGTAGSLGLIDREFDAPFMVTNCDIIIHADYLDLYNFHLKNEYDITLVASAKEYIIPYGTCELTDEGHLARILERPQFNFLVNAGLYVLNPGVLQFIPPGQVYHITQLIEDARKNGKRIGVYPIDEDAWIDIGQWAEYQKAVERL